jgi:hypothetical protein
MAAGDLPLFDAETTQVIVRVTLLLFLDLEKFSYVSPMRDNLGVPLPLDIRSRQAVFESTPELLSRGEWVCLNIQPNVAWPVRPQSLHFFDQRIWIIPITIECYPGVAMRCPPGMTRDDAEGILYRLLSVISWRESCGIVVAHRSGGSLPHMMGLEKKSGFSIRDSFDFTDLICPQEDDPRVALALMREARGLNHYGYAFLSYWRILELAFPKAGARVAWMQAALPTLSGQGVQDALASIAAEGVTDVCRHLFGSGRCAIAHATGQPIINPDDPRDAARLLRELPLVREMATRAIEERFGIDTPMTEYRKHLYELRGWKERLGSQFVERILSGDQPKDGELVDLPLINVRLRESPPYLPLEDMKPAAVFVDGQLLELHYCTADNLMVVRFRLNFAEERLLFDVTNGLYLHDDSSVTAAEYQREVQRFLRDYFLNGVLQMWDTDNGALLSRLDAFIPVNCMVDLDACNAGIAKADAEIERRRSALAEIA